MADTTPPPAPMPSPDHGHDHHGNRIVFPVVYTVNNCNPTICQAQVIEAKNKFINDLANSSGNSIAVQNTKISDRAKQIQAAEAACNNFTGTTLNNPTIVY